MSATQLGQRQRLTIPELILASVLALLLFIATTYGIFMGLSFLCGLVAGIFADGMTVSKAAVLLGISAVAGCLVTLPIMTFAVRRLGARVHSPVDQR